MSLGFILRGKASAKKGRAEREVGPSLNAARVVERNFILRASNCGVLLAGAIRDGCMLFRGGNHFLARARH
jgi:hypothetical protein